MKQRVIERHMFYGAKKNIFLKAIALRKNMTKAEKMLWKKLKDKTIFIDRWKRQQPIDIFIADFYCHKYKIVIEVDGEIHLNKEVSERDDGKTHDLEKLGITVLRFTNNEIIENIDSVISIIKQVIFSKSPLQGVGGCPGTVPIQEAIGTTEGYYRESGSSIWVANFSF